MKKRIAMLLLVLISVMMIANDAMARRFGGGRSFGVSRSATSYTRTNSNYVRGAQGPQQNRWVGALTGLAIGSMLTSLFMGHSFAGGGLMLIVLMGAVMLLFAFYRRTSNNSYQSAHVYHRQNQQHYAASSSASLTPQFDEADFLRKAKVLFIRMQAAFDQKNLQDLSQFTTPNVFAEIKMQLQENGNAENITDVVTLDAELLDVKAESREQTASVRFTGLIKEERNAPAIHINEIWHLRTTPDSDVWQVAGVQQH